MLSASLVGEESAPEMDGLVVFWVSFFSVSISLITVHIPRRLPCSAFSTTFTHPWSLVFLFLFRFFLEYGTVRTTSPKKTHLLPCHEPTSCKTSNRIVS